MSDIFREVDEDVRSDQLTSLWSKYSIVVLGLAIAIVVGTAIFVYMRHDKQVRDEAAGARYQSAEALALQNKPAAAATAFDEIARTAPHGYRILARLRAAEETSLTDPASAVRQFDALAADTSVDPLLSGLARLRAGLLRVDEADKDEMLQRFGPLLNGPYRHTAREYLGLAALKRGDAEAAGKWFDEIVIDPNAPANLRQRVQAFLSLVSGGGKFAAPPPTPAAPPAAPPAASAAPAQKKTP